MKPDRAKSQYHYVTAVEGAILVEVAEALFDGAAAFRDSLCDVEHRGPVDIRGMMDAARAANSAAGQALRIAREYAPWPALSEEELRRWSRHGKTKEHHQAGFAPPRADGDLP